MNIKIPASPRRKALIVVDVQPQTLAPKAQALIPLMASFIAQVDYSAYVEANYFADQNSMFFKQDGFLKTKEETGPSAEEIRSALSSKSAPHLLIEKNTRSCFKSSMGNEVRMFLERNEIEEVHFIGYDINDCVLASAYEAIDLGYFTYVIEELCHHWNADEMLKRVAITIYRRQSMSNHGDHQLMRTIEVS